MTEEFIVIDYENDKEKFLDTLYLTEDECDVKVFESSKYRIVIDKVDDGFFHVQVLSRPLEGKIVSWSWNPW